jgi:hypothetical protein
MTPPATRTRRNRQLRIVPGPVVRSFGLSKPVFPETTPGSWHRRDGGGTSGKNADRTAPICGRSAIVHAEPFWLRGPRRISYQGPGTRSCLTPPQLLSAAVYSYMTHVIQQQREISRICQGLLICVCYSGARLPFPTGRALRKPYEIKALASKTRS